MIENQTTVFIYSLSEPISRDVKYIGKTNHLKRRYNHHICYANKTTCPKSSWIKSLLQNGLKPEMEVVDEVSVDDWGFWEEWWISMFRSWGFSLKNLHEGGGITTHSQETRNKISGRLIGRKLPKETCEKMSRSRMGRVVSNETKDKISQSNKTSLTKEVIQKRIDNKRANGGFIVNDATRAKMSKSNKGMPPIATETLIKIKRENSPIILQYTKDGEFIKEWIMFDAKKQYSVRIKDAIRKSELASGYRWFYKTDDNFPLKILPYKRIHGSPVPLLRCDKSMDIIDEWEHAGIAGRTLGICDVSIRNNCKGKTKSAGGFVWIYKNKTT